MGNLVKLGTRIVMKGFEVWNKIQELPARAMNKLLKTMVNGPVKEVVEKVSELFRTFCKSAGKVATSGITTGLVGLALIGGGINVEAKGGTCKLPINRVNGAKGEYYIRSIYGSISEKPVYKSYTVGNTTYKRYVDVVTADGIGIEVKVGRTGLTQRIRKQILKDVELRNRGELTEVRWEFMKSPETGMGGPSKALENFLIENNIDYDYKQIDL